MSTYTIGVDPGWASFGVAISKDEVLLTKKSYVPKTFSSISAFILELESLLTGTYSLGEADFEKVFLERFVSYSGIQADGEHVLMLIGALVYYFESRRKVEVNLVRALDWKVKVCQYLVKAKGLSNPYSKLDKKFSVWAALSLTGDTVKSDHEADAMCLSFLTKEMLNGKIK